VKAEKNVTKRKFSKKSEKWEKENISSAIESE